MNNQKGSVMLIVIVVLTVALAVGVNVSSRLISSVSRITNSDVFSKAYSAAEGGIERFLVFDYEEIYDIYENDACDSYDLDNLDYSAGCRVEFPISDASTTSIADVVIEEFTYTATVPHNGNNYGSYEYYLGSGEIHEVNLEGYSDNEVYLCWNTSELDSSSLDSLVYFNFVTDGSASDIYSPTFKAGISCSNTVDSCTNSSRFPPLLVPVGDSDFEFLDSEVITSFNSFERCVDLSSKLSSDDLSLRFGFFNSDLSLQGNMGVFLNTNSFPVQGYKLTSTGKVGNNVAGNITVDLDTQSSVEAFVKTPFLPGFYDYTILMPNNSFVSSTN
jgi:hypothetical protein